MTEPSSDRIHASSVSIDGVAVLLAGRSDSGKSDLALRLIDRGAQLVSDDYTVVTRDRKRLLASAPATIAGKIEVRGVGICEFDAVSKVPIGLVVELDEIPSRLPEPATRVLAGLEVPLIALSAFEASAPIKVELTLKSLGRK